MAGSTVRKSLASATHLLSKSTRDEAEDVKNFFAAAEKKDYKSLENYIDSGVDPNIRHSIHEAALHFAVKYGDMVLLTILLSAENIDINIPTLYDLSTPLHLAAMYESVSIIESLLKHGADVNAVDKNYCSCLHIAVSNGNIRIVSILLENEANPNVHNDFYNSPLSIAILDKRHYKISKLLLENGADVHYPRPESIPLFYEVILASAYAELRFLRLLWQNGANPNIVDRTGKRAMHYAALKGLPETAAFLHIVGAIEGLEDFAHKTPLDIAEAHGNTEVARLLRQYRQERALNNLLLKIPS